jgi:hypothetical protein
MSSIWTEAELLEQIADTKAAIKATLAAQSYETSSGRKLERANLYQLRETLDYLKSELASLRGQAGPFAVSGRVLR